MGHCCSAPKRASAVPWWGPPCGAYMPFGGPEWWARQATSLPSPAFDWSCAAPPPRAGAGVPALGPACSASMGPGCATQGSAASPAAGGAWPCWFCSAAGALWRGPRGRPLPPRTGAAASGAGARASACGFGAAASPSASCCAVPASPRAGPGPSPAAAAAAGPPPPALPAPADLLLLLPPALAAFLAACKTWCRTHDAGACVRIVCGFGGARVQARARARGASTGAQRPAPANLKMGVCAIGLACTSRQACRAAGRLAACCCRAQAPSTPPPVPHLGSCLAVHVTPLGRAHQRGGRRDPRLCQRLRCRLQSPRGPWRWQWRWFERVQGLTTSIRQAVGR